MYGEVLGANERVVVDRDHVTGVDVTAGIEFAPTFGEPFGEQEAGQLQLAMG